MKNRSVTEAAERKTVELPQLNDLTGNMLSRLTAALGVDRDVVASDDEIKGAWSRLPRLIRRIPQDLRDENIVKACIAIASGLFDSAINYVWNAAVIELRQKVRRFGLHVIPQVIDDKSFGEEYLVRLRDYDLLRLCLKLNLITQKGSFDLNQCLEMRNNYSAAHPSDGYVDEDEVVNFISRCQKHALSDTRNPKGVDTKKFLDSLKSSRFRREQKEEWKDRIRATFDVQRDVIFGMLHGIYCDPNSGQEARVNSLSICSDFKSEFSPETRSLLLDRHQDYIAKGDKQRCTASRQFFEKLGLVSLLGESEIHRLITSASRQLLRVHNDWYNFYCEPPYAERLERIARGVQVPESAQAVFVETVITCGVGNRYGVSRAAMPSYRAMVRSFSPKEIKIMLRLAEKSDVVSHLIQTYDDCKKRFRALVDILDKSSIPTSAKAAYREWRQQR